MSLRHAGHRRSQPVLYAAKNAASHSSRVPRKNVALQRPHCRPLGDWPTSAGFPDSRRIPLQPRRRPRGCSRPHPKWWGYLTSEESRHRPHPSPPMRRILHRSFDPRWKCLQSAPPYQNGETIRAEVLRLSLPGNTEVQSFPPRLAVDVCCSSSSLPLPRALALSVTGLAPLPVFLELGGKWYRLSRFPFLHFFAKLFQRGHRGEPAESWFGKPQRCGQPDKSERLPVFPPRRIVPGHPRSL